MVVCILLLLGLAKCCSCHIKALSFHGAHALETLRSSSCAGESWPSVLPPAGLHIQMEYVTEDGLFSIDIVLRPPPQHVNQRRPKQETPAAQSPFAH